MAMRKKMSRAKNKRAFRNGSRVHPKNEQAQAATQPYRGGFRL